MTTLKTFLTLGLLALSGPALASASVATLADGAPWNASLDNGRTMKLTLNPDGSGKMNAGLMSRKISWTEKDSKLCLSGMPRTNGPRCLSPVATQGGYRLLMEDGQAISLSR